MGVVCYKGSNFVDALAYADDIVISASTATPMHKLLAICEECARECYFSFIANKSKYMVTVPNSRRGGYTIYS